MCDRTINTVILPLLNMFHVVLRRRVVQNQFCAHRSAPPLDVSAPFVAKKHFSLLLFFFIYELISRVFCSRGHRAAFHPTVCAAMGILQLQTRFVILIPLCF